MQEVRRFYPFFPFAAATVRQDFDWQGYHFPLNFIPQGGGDYYTNHRCPGEWITIELMKVALNLLTQYLQYDIPQQYLEISLSTMPTAPKSGLVISNVKLIS